MAVPPLTSAEHRDLAVASLRFADLWINDPHARIDTQPAAVQATVGLYLQHANAHALMALVEAQPATIPDLKIEDEAAR